MRHFKKYLIVVVTAFVLGACHSSDPEKKVSDQTYYPLQKGLYSTYKVTGTSYTDLNPPADLKYQLQTEVVDSFPATGGGYEYVLYNSIMQDGASSFAYDDTWSAKVDTQHAIVNEENTSYLKLTFPVRAGGKWNGNTYNTLGELNYTIESTGKPFTQDGITFDDCVVVIESNTDNLVLTDIRKEVYARNIGLVYVEKTILNYCTTNDCFGQKKIKNGIVYKQILTAHGKK